MYAARTGYRRQQDEQLASLKAQNEALRRENEALKKEIVRLRESRGG